MFTEIQPVMMFGSLDNCSLPYLTTPYQLQREIWYKIKSTAFITKFCKAEVKLSLCFNWATRNKSVLGR